MLWRSAPASPCGPLPPAPFHGRYAVGLCPQLSFQAVGLSFPLPLGKNMHGRIRRKRFWTGLRKAVGKSVSTAETAATESAGVIPPPTRSRLSERSVSIAGAASRESPPVPPFQPEQPLWVLQRNQNQNQNRHPQYRTRFRRLRPQLRSSGIRLRSILRGFWTRSTRFRSQ